MARAPRSWIVAACLALAACGTEATPCEEACPPVGGTYRVVGTGQSGFCVFEAYSLMETVVLEQAADGTVSAEVLDPATLTTLPLTGALYHPQGNGLADFSLAGRAVRPAPSGAELFSLRVVLTGTIASGDGGRQLAGTLTTADLGTASGSGAGCTATVSFTAREE